MGQVIAGPAARIGIGGPKARKLIESGDLSCALHYINERESACFFPRYRSGDIYVVSMDELWEIGDDGQLLKHAVNAAKALGFSAFSRMEVAALAKFINDCGAELFAMKPMPVEKNEPKPEVAVEGNRIQMVFN